jgi:SAM-dependent methyltransferase
MHLNKTVERISESIGTDSGHAMAASPADEIIGIYRRHAAAWAQARGTALGEKAWLDRFLGLLPLGASVLDIGCGPGVPIARYLTQRGCMVMGIDSSPELLALFAQNLPGRPTRLADMRRLALGQVSDGLIAWDSFFHLRPADQRAMFQVFGAHAAPAAALMFTSGPSHGEAIGVLEGEALYHASLDGAEYRELLGQQGFDVVAQRNEDPACGGRTVWLARQR